MSITITATVLTIMEPWLWATAERFKPGENRSRNTSYRGTVYLAASKTFDRQGYMWIGGTFPKLLHWMGKEESWCGARLGFPLKMPLIKPYAGHIIAKATLYDVVTSHDSPWFSGPYFYLWKDVQRLPKPIPVRGMPGFFKAEIPEEMA